MALHVATADALPPGIGAGPFDMVVINSVAQYFPGADYLVRVIAAAVNATAPGGTVFVGDVRDLADILSERAIDRVDHVVSGLPVPSLPRATQRALFQAVGKVLRSDGSYNQITEIPLIYWPFYRRHFHEVRFAFEVTVRMLPWPSRPRRDSSLIATRRKWLP